jgi:hypothetical protein
MATYELWQMRSGNLMATFETEPAALAAIREAMRRHGAGYAATLALGREDGRGRSKPIAMGAELAERAAAVEPTVPTSVAAAATKHARAAGHDSDGRVDYSQPRSPRRGADKATGPATPRAVSKAGYTAPGSEPGGRELAAATRWYVRRDPRTGRFVSDPAGKEPAEPPRKARAEPPLRRKK